MDERVISLQGGGRTSQNSQGSGIKEDICFTLNVIDVHGVCYGISRSALKGGSGSNGGMPIGEEFQPAIVAQGTGAVCYQIGGPRNAFCETDISRTLDTSCLQPACNEGGMAIVHIIDHSRRHNYQQLDTVPTLEAHMGTGGGNVPLVLMEESDGSLSEDH